MRVAGGLLQSTFPVIELATAAVGASLGAAAVLEAVRTHREAVAVGVDAAHVAVAVRSERYARKAHSAAGPSFNKLSAFFEAADGWIRLHANYPWHRARLLDVLGAGATRHAVAAAVRKWPAVELESEVAAAGGCAAAVRSASEWLVHPQGSCISPLPLADLFCFGDAPPRSWKPSTAPARGVRVLDATRVIAGPVCTRTLAAHGADVLRIDSPDLRENPDEMGDTLAGKRSALLDLRSRSGRLQLEELLSGADVVVSGYRPGALSRFGLGPDALAERHPGLVVLTLCAWGHVGPWSARRGFDSLVQAASGIAVAEARGGPEPGALPAQLLDHATGYLAAAAVLSGLARQMQEGGTWQGRVSLAQTAAWVLRQRPPGAAALPAGPASEPDPGPYMCRWPAVDGDIEIVGPPGSLSRPDGSGWREVAWSLPPARYGRDEAVWKPR
jgi:crotonobetainyl-CoA:carnitine CoA-transferase CaiB-like acyl-CoA transferase